MDFHFHLEGDYPSPPDSVPTPKFIKSIVLSNINNLNNTRETIHHLGTDILLDLKMNQNEYERNPQFSWVKDLNTMFSFHADDRRDAIANLQIRQEKGPGQYYCFFLFLPAPDKKYIVVEFHCETEIEFFSDSEEIYMEIDA